VAKIVQHKPPRAVVFGEEARFVDEQESGPFKAWRHEHDFERVDAKSTRVVDRITYRVGWGPIGCSPTLWSSGGSSVRCFATATRCCASSSARRPRSDGLVVAIASGRADR
jgi:hypothetical protein